MQFFYQFPERCERLALVSSGGLGREVSWPLRRRRRARASRRCWRGATSRPGAARRCAGIDNVYAAAAHRALSSLDTPEARRGFLWTLRVGHRPARPEGLRQRPPLPARRHADADRLGRPRPHHPGRARPRRRTRPAPGSRFELLPDARHFPHLEDAAGLADAIARFLAETTPAALGAAEWARLMRRLRAA